MNDTAVKKKLMIKYINMKQRCYNPKATGYKLYGGRGIKVSDDWNESFTNFYEDMKDTYKEGLTLERINNNEDYSVNNCKWTDHKSQCNNRRNNTFIKHNGRKQTLQQWADELGVKHNTLSMRITQYGWSIDKALSTPARRRA